MVKSNITDDFVPINGFERYKISRNGDVLGIHGRKLKALPHKGYFCHILMASDGTKKWFNLHRLIAQAFIPNPENKPEVNHINGIRSDHRILNLEWCSHAENMRHAVATGLHKNTRRGQSHPKAKLTENDVRLIRFLDKKGVMQKRLCSEFSVSKGVISNIINRASWVHI